MLKTTVRKLGEHDQTSQPARFKPKLEDMGITYSDSSRWQAIASIPELDFEQKITETKDKRRELTSAMFYTPAIRKAREAKREKHVTSRDKFTRHWP